MKHSLQLYQSNALIMLKLSICAPSCITICMANCKLYCLCTQAVSRPLASACRDTRGRVCAAQGTTHIFPCIVSVAHTFQTTESKCVQLCVEFTVISMYKHILHDACMQHKTYFEIRYMRPFFAVLHQQPCQLTNVHKFR
jgi:hypothetical protein